MTSETAAVLRVHKYIHKNAVVSGSHLVHCFAMLILFVLCCFVFSCLQKVYMKEHMHYDV